jgi:AraC-like DNA-binding protein
MAHIQVAPPLPLRPLVRAFSYWEGSEPSTDLLAVMATRLASLQIDLHDDELRWYPGLSPLTANTLRGVTLTGPQTRPFAVDSWQPRLVRVLFQPGGTSAFFSVSPVELRDTQLSVADLWGTAAERLQQRLAETTQPAELFRLLGEALLSSITDHRPIRPPTAQALALLELPPTDLGITELARRVDTSPKRLIRLFTEDVGVTPKRYVRMTRFERVLASAFARPGPDWAQVAVEHGYFDQSHLIREFHDFAGMTPGAYLTRRGPAEHHARV